MTAEDGERQYQKLLRRFPERARPVGFYPLPTTRVSEPFQVGWLHERLCPLASRLLYIHVPFCNQRCHYCRFFPGPNSAGIEDSFLQGARSQLAWWARKTEVNLPTLDAAFLGGGSPSALSAAGIRQLLNAIREQFELAPTAEITMEWYPADADPLKIETAIDMGVTRFSIGAQSWNRETLGQLGCHHEPGQIDKLIESMRSAGVSNINLDLMCNVPGQSLEDHLDDVRHARDSGAAMISTNILELTSGTPYSAVGGTEAGESEKRKWLHRTSAILREMGYRNQRVRNFYRDDHVHRYNALCLGTGFDILPVGPGAYGYVAGMPLISQPDRKTWLTAPEDSTVTGYSRVTNDELRRAFVINCLVELKLEAAAYHRQFGTDVFADFPLLAELRDEGAIIRTCDGWRLSDPAVEFADDVSVALYSTAQRGLFARHLNVGRSNGETQYFPVPATIGRPASS